MFDKGISGDNVIFTPLTIRDIIFRPLPHRDESCHVISSHQGERHLLLSLPDFRHITLMIAGKLRELGYKKGDTLLLASFSSSNELGNALVFASAVSLGIRVFKETTPCIILTDQCFHGYTSGARSLLNAKKQRNLFSGLLKLVPLFVNDTLENWKDVIRKHTDDNFCELSFARMAEGRCVTEKIKFSSVIASLIEPVRGEGGIYPVNTDMADFLAIKDFPLISDEIQCGMGRTGSFPSYPKASCYLLQVLKIVGEGNIPFLAGERGKKLSDLIREVADEFPEIIESVNGKGLMTGIHFNPAMSKDTNILRVLPSLSKPNSLRIEPSVYLPDGEMQRLALALRELCILCRENSIYELTKYLMNNDPYTDRPNPVLPGSFPRNIELPAPQSVRAGFIGNFTLPHRELQVLEPDLLKASDTGLRILFNKFRTVMDGKPVRIMSKNLMGGRTHFTFYILPFDTSHLEIVNRWGKKRYYVAKIQEAADLLASEGVKNISLGAHTSIITGNGLNLAERGSCKILTGNTLTVASAIHYLKKSLKKFREIYDHPPVIAVVGAGGNIGSGITRCLGEESFSSCVILLSGGNVKKLALLKDTLIHCKNVRCSEDLFSLRMADIIAVCANTNDPIIFPHHLSREKPVTIIDISVPGAVADDVLKLDNVEFCRDASSVFLPDEPDFRISSHTPAGKIFCCAGETLLYALYDPGIPLKGHIQTGSVRELLKLAEKEIFFK